MTVDIPHMLANLAVIIVVVLAFRRLGILSSASKGVRIAAMIVGVVAAVYVLNLVWPFGEAV